VTDDKRDYTAKYDQGKTDWSLLPWKPIEQAAQIMTDAINIKGYGRDSWRTVKGGQFRYWSAALRHLFERFVLGNIIDQESGYHHLAHALCNIAFVCQKDIEHFTDMNPLDHNFYDRDI